MGTDDDRLSGLSDDLILKVLSFVGSKDGVRTSVLSSRWRYLWTSIPGLSFSSVDFSSVVNLSNFVSHVSSMSRHNIIKLSSFNLFFDEKGKIHANRIMNRVFSNLNVQQVNITCFFGSNNRRYSHREVPFPLSLSGSQTLKQLTLQRPLCCYCDQIVITSAHEFSSLTSLNLCSITLYDDFFSMFPNLKNLTLYSCKVTGSSVLRICHPRLSNLTLEEGHVWTRAVNVVTPQLKNLTILKYYGEFRVSTPELDSLLVKGPPPSMFSAVDGFPCLENALLSFHSINDLSISSASTIITLLQQFHKVKLLSLSMEIIQLLNSSVELISQQPFPLANLESLRLLPRIDVWDEHVNSRDIVSTEVKKYLLSSSPKATLTEVLQEECWDVFAGANLGSI